MISMTTHIHQASASTSAHPTKHQWQNCPEKHRRRDGRQKNGSEYCLRWPDIDENQMKHVYVRRKNEWKKERNLVTQKINRKIAGWSKNKNRIRFIFNLVSHFLCVCVLVRTFVFFDSVALVAHVLVSIEENELLICEKTGKKNDLGILLWQLS